LRQTRGDLNLKAEDFLGWSRGARLYPLLYMLTRVCRAVDWESGIALSNHLLGHLQTLQVHHIFPKKILYEHGYERSQVNAIANFTFLTQSANLWILDRKPEDYLSEVEAKHPGALASHWIPVDPSLWKVDRYEDFLAAMRSLLAKAGNGFLNSLLNGAVPELEAANLATGKQVVAAEDDNKPLIDLNQWVVGQGLPAGIFNYQLNNLAGEDQEIVDLAWPDGLQVNLSQPVAIFGNDQNGGPKTAAQAEFRVFTDLDKFKTYISHEILAS
jgi:hypothetical protein